MTNSDNENHKFEDIYKEFEEKIFLKEINSTKNLRRIILTHIKNYLKDKTIEEIAYDTVEDTVQIDNLDILFDYAGRGWSKYLPVETICHMDLEQENAILKQVGKYFQEAQFNDKYL